MVLLLTDGPSNCGDSTEAALALQNTTEIFLLSVGDLNGDGTDQLRAYVSQPQDDHVFTLGGYQDMRDIVDYAEQYIASTQCPPF